MKPSFQNKRILALAGLLMTGYCAAFPAGAAVTVPAPAPETEAAKQTPVTKPSEPAVDDYTQDARIMGELARRKTALDRREKELELREAQVSAAELLARREIKELSSLRGEVEKIVTEQTNDASADLAMLAGLFSNMKPAQAAAIIGKLEIPKAAAILRRLDTRMAGPVLAAMDPSIAAGIARELDRAHAPFQDNPTAQAANDSALR
jgi:flagellar motility protein MotE (MotC chaperone)